MATDIGIRNLETMTARLATLNGGSIGISRYSIEIEILNVPRLFA